MPNIGPLELIVVLVIVLLVFGPKRLPGLGKQLGSGMREFKESLTSKSDDDDDESGETERRDAFGQPAVPSEREATTVPREPVVAPREPAPEVVSGEARPEDQPARRTDG
jgi:sec-independent protein translocase protein TatA